MRVLALAPAAVLALAACATARPKLEPLTYTSDTETWPSGLRVVATDLPHRPGVIVSASYRVGSADDPPGKEGLAHLVEHLTFRARPGGGPHVWHRLESLGVEFDGRTAPDATDYFASGDPEQLDALLRIEADRLRDPLAGIGPEQLEREREVVVHELTARGGPTSTGAQVEWLSARAFAGHPYARAATAASLRSLTLEDVRAFVARHYTPARVVLVVAGPFGVRAAFARARAAFAPLVGDAAAPVEPVADAPRPPDLDAPVASALEVREAPVERPVLWLAWAVPSEVGTGGARALAAVRFLEARVDAVVSGKERERALSLDLHVHGVGEAALVLARVALRRTDDAQPLLDAVRKELRFHRWQRDDLVHKDQLRARLVLEAQVRLEALDPTDLARWLRATGRPDYLNKLPDAVGDALERDTAEYVGHYLRGDRLVALAVVPGGAPPAPEVPAVAGASVVAEEGGHHGDPPEAETPPPDPSVAMRSPRLASAFRRTLRNGLQVVVARRPGFRVVSAHLVVRTPPAGPLQRVRQVLALRAATCNMRPATVAGDRLEFGARAPSAFVLDALEQVGCRAGPVSVDGPAFDRARDELADMLERTEASVHERAGQRLLEELFPGHPYSREVTAEAVRASTSADAARWLTETLRPDRSTLILTGDVDLTDALWRRVVERFERWFPRRRTPVPEVERAPAPARRTVVVVDRPDWPTAELTVALRVPPRAERAEPAFRTLAWRLADALRARLRMNEALTYRVTVSVLEQSLGSALLVSTTVDARRAAETLAEVLTELGAARAPLGDDALARARWHAAREAAHGLGTSWRNALRLQEMFVHRLPADEWDTFAARTARLGPAEVREAAEGWGVGREVVVVIGDAAVLAPLLRLSGHEPEVVRPPARPVDAPAAARR